MSGKPPCRPSATQWLPSRKGKLWTGRIMSTLPAAVPASLDGVMKTDEAGVCRESNGSARYSRERYCPTWNRRAGLRHPLCNFHARPFSARTVDWLSRRCRRHARTRWRSALSHTLFPVYFAILVWGGLYLARRATARTHSIAQLASRSHTLTT